jgi:hypothetical protein
MTSAVPPLCSPVLGPPPLDGKHVNLSGHRAAPPSSKSELHTSQTSLYSIRTFSPRTSCSCCTCPRRRFERWHERRALARPCARPQVLIAARRRSARARSCLAAAGAQPNRAPLGYIGWPRLSSETIARGKDVERKYRKNMLSMRNQGSKGSILQRKDKQNALPSDSATRQLKNNRWQGPAPRRPSEHSSTFDFRARRIADG